MPSVVPSAWAVGRPSLASRRGGSGWARPLGLIEIGRSLGLASIAEGIETAEQLRSLLANGCTHMQGYLLGRPVPAEEFEAQLNSERPPWIAELEHLRA